MDVTAEDVGGSNDANDELVEPPPLEFTTTFFVGMSADERQLILQHAKHRHFPEGATIVGPGDDHREVCIIQSGMALVSVPERDGKHRITHRLGPGSTLGELSFFTGHRTLTTIRAATDLDLYALSEARFRYVAAQIPRIYANLGLIMAQKLSDLDQVENRPNLQLAACLIDHGAPPITGYALAASVAWHTRHSTLLLIVGDRAEGDIDSFVHDDPDVPVPEPCVHVARFTGDRSTLAGTIEDYALRYHHILVQIPPDWPPPEIEGSIVCLDGEGASAEPKPGMYTIRYGADHGSAHPDHRGVLTVPNLTTSEQDELREGLLSTAGAAGKALGWAARDLAHLKVGVALGAGSSKGFGHIGVLQVLIGKGLPIDYLAGTSIGSCVAAMYALDYDFEEMAAILAEVGASAWSPTIPRASILSPGKLKRRLRRLTGDRRIEDLPIPTAIVAADILAHRQVVFRRGLIWPAILASIAVPGAFPPQAIGGHLLVDGGVVNPVPNNIAANMGADIVIGIKLSTHELGEAVDTQAIEGIGSAPWLFHTMMRAMDIMQTRVTAASAEAATIQIDLDFSREIDPGLRHFGEGRRFVDFGERAAHEALPRIAAALPWMGAKGQSRV